MNNKKNIIIIISVIVIIVLSIVFFTFTNFQNKEDLDNTDTDLRDEDIELIDNENKKIQKLNSYVELNTVRNCIHRFYSSYLYTNNDNVNEVENYQNKVYKMLSKDYIEKNNIQTNEIKSISNNIEDLSVEIYDIYTASQYFNNQEEYGNVKIYFVNGIIRNLNTLEGIEFNLIILLDNVNNTFEVYMSDYKDYYRVNISDIGKEVDFNIPESIENRGDNTFSIVGTTMDDIAKYRFDIVKTLLTIDVDKAYDLLINQSIEQFSDINEFRTFIENNKKDIYFLAYSSYSLRYDEDKLFIDCYDKKDKFCISIYCDEYSSFKFDITEI